MNRRNGKWFAVRAACIAFGVAAGTAMGCWNTYGVTSDAGTCASSLQVVCGSACADLQKDPGNCGACGKACAAGELCSLGTCATSCGGGTMQCGQSCTLLKDDPQNCGACGTACPNTEVCAAGKCASTCGVAQTICGGNCVDTKTDNANCGACQHACASGEVCGNSVCAVSCQAGLSLCKAPVTDGGVSDASTDAQADGGLGFPYCAHLQTDNANCGACGVVCPSGQKCSNGACGAN